MSEIIVGKHTLESLTSGMYSDPYVVFREYIQNAADSLDEAEKCGINNVGQGQIAVQLLPAEGKISISDNGIGVQAANAEKTLISIGNSKKISNSSRGFRGIGRLAALGYCNKLIFETSYYQESKGTRITINSRLLAELLSTTVDDDMSVVEVLQKVYTVETFDEKEKSHYFKVYLEGIDEASGLTDYEDVYSYISQNAPVPYDPAFDWGQEITSRLRKEGIAVQSYNISVTFGLDTIPVYKPYRNDFLVDKGKQLRDRIQDIDIIQVRDASKELYAIGWIGKTNYLGSIYDKSVKGIRLRKGNILIGDSQTLNTTFKDARFNGWSIGEVFAVNVNLIPNARRDNFEKNAAYFLLMESLSAISSNIARDIRSASLARNQELANALKKSDQVQKDATEAIVEGLHSSRKGSLKLELSSAQEQIANTRTKGEADSYYQEIAFEELDMLIGAVKGATGFKAINAIGTLSNAEKRVLEKVCTTLIVSIGEESKPIIDIILNGFMK